MNAIGKASAWLAGFIVFIMIIAAWSRISTMKEPGQAIRGGSDFLVNLFKGVLK